MLIDVGETSYAVQQEGKASDLTPAKWLASRRTAFGLVPSASSLFSLRSDFQGFLNRFYPWSASPLVMLAVFALLVGWFISGLFRGVV